jgi:hypothetical protein
MLGGRYFLVVVYFSAQTLEGVNGLAILGQGRDLLLGPSCKHSCWICDFQKLSKGRPPITNRCSSANMYGSEIGLVCCGRRVRKIKPIVRHVTDLSQERLHQAVVEDVPNVYHFHFRLSCASLSYQNLHRPNRIEQSCCCPSQILKSTQLFRSGASINLLRTAPTSLRRTCMKCPKVTSTVSSAACMVTIVGMWYLFPWLSLSILVKLHSSRQ